MSTLARLSLFALAALASMLSAASGMKPDSAKTSDWAAYWVSVGVDPAPPKGFLKVSYDGRVENLTNGKISDETARKWAIASLRRGQGDRYASINMREDIANAGVFGPKGLNGTSEQIQAFREAGVVRMEGAFPETLAVAVMLVPSQLKAEDSSLTDYVIVRLSRAPAGPATLIYRDGHSESRTGRKAGELAWQLDTGHFFEHPVLGPLWYQKNGWSCRPDGTPIGQLCAQLKPATDNRPPS